MKLARSPALVAGNGTAPKRAPLRCGASSPFPSAVLGEPLRRGFDSVLPEGYPVGLGLIKRSELGFSRELLQQQPKALARIRALSGRPYGPFPFPVVRTGAVVAPAQRGAPTVTDHVYKSLELTGSSRQSSDDAIRTAIERASKSIRDIRWFHVTEVRGHVVEGKVAHWQVTVKVGFTLQE